MTLETWFKNLELFKPDWNVCKTTENKFTFSYILNSLDLTEGIKVETNIIKKKIFELCKNPSKVRFWYKNMYPDYTYSAQTEPNARKVHHTEIVLY